MIVTERSAVVADNLITVPAGETSIAFAIRLSYLIQPFGGGEHVRRIVDLDTEPDVVFLGERAPGFHPAGDDRYDCERFGSRRRLLGPCEGEESVDEPRQPPHLRE